MDSEIWNQEMVKSVCVCVCVCVCVRMFALPVLRLCVSVYYRHTEKYICLPVCLENLPIYLEN